MRLSRTTALAIPLALAALAFAAGSADAAARFASPSGSGIACTELSPCSLSEAIGPNSEYGGDVTVEPGTYGSPGAPLNQLSVYWYTQHVHGRPGAPDPVIYVSTPDPRPSSTPGYGFDAYKSYLSHLDIRVVGTATTYYGVSAFNGSLDHVKVTGDARWGACTGNSDMTDVLCQTSSPTATGIGIFNAGPSSGTPISFTQTYRNVTAIGSGTDGVGLDIVMNDGTIQNLTVINSIFDGAAVDVRTEANGVNSASANLTISTSNFPLVEAGANTSVTSNAAAGNQSTPALFANAGALDFNAAPGSPTIDAGADDAANGTTDLAGAPRIQGYRTDIGAYESSLFGTPDPAPPAIATVISGLKAKTKKFTSARSGSTFRPPAKRPKPKKGRRPVGTLITFVLSRADTVKFTLERAGEGRKSGSRCVKRSRGNAKKKKCTYYRAVKGTESYVGTSGKNTVWFTGRWKGRPLSAGAKFRMLAAPVSAGTGDKPVVLRPQPFATFAK